MRYAYRSVKTLHHAESYRSYASDKPTNPIKGFQYAETVEGQNVLTANASQNVVAYVAGFMKLEKGTHELEFHANDGLRVTLGGVQVYEHDDLHPCETTGDVTVFAPKSTWCPLEALYFQGQGTACLQMNVRTQEGPWKATDDNIYAHSP